jgi:hypothetical protein
LKVVVSHAQTGNFSSYQGVRLLSKSEVRQRSKEAISYFRHGMFQISAFYMWHDYFCKPFVCKIAASIQFTLEDRNARNINRQALTVQEMVRYFVVHFPEHNREQSQDANI